MFVYLCSRPANRHSLMAGFMADAHINIDYSAAIRIVRRLVEA